MLFFLLGICPSKLSRPVANPARCEPCRFRCDGSEAVLGFCVSESLDVNLSCLLKSVASVALGISERLCVEGTIAGVVDILQSDLPFRIFLPASNRPGINTESFCDGVDVS